MATFNFLGVSPMGFTCGTGGVTKDRLVKLDSSGNAIAVTAITDVCIGVALETKAVGEVAAVQIFGKCRATSSAGASVNDRLMWATGGKVATLSGSTAKIVGVALNAPADGEIQEFLATFPSVNDTQ